MRNVPKLTGSNVASPAKLTEINQMIGENCPNLQLHFSVGDMDFSPVELHFSKEDDSKPYSIDFAVSYVRYLSDENVVVKGELSRPGREKHMASVKYDIRQHVFHLVYYLDEGIILSRSELTLDCIGRDTFESFLFNIRQ